MKLNSIAAICKKNKCVILFDKVNEDGDCVAQWIGDGYACYPVAGLPYLKEENIMTIFDIPDKDRSKWHFRSDPLPDGLCFEDTDGGERQLDKADMTIGFGGESLMPLHTLGGLVFIQSKYLAPLADSFSVLELFERRTEKGLSYIVAKAGFLIQAVIMPYDVISEAFVDKLDSLTRSCERAYEAKQDARRRAEAEEGNRQIYIGTMAVDAETGEVLEEGTEDAEE